MFGVFYNTLIYSKSLEYYKEHLKEILQVLKNHQLFANGKKLNFAQRDIYYLGHLISGNRVAAYPKKI